MNGNKTVTANFTAIPPVTLTVTPSNQNVPSTAGSTTFAVNTTPEGAFYNVSSTASWLHFSASGNGDNANFSVSYDANTGTQRVGSITFTIPGTNLPGADATVTVTQAAGTTPTTYTLTTNVSPTGAGTVTKSPDQTSYTSGAVVTLTAIPASGYTFSNWSGDASGTSTTTTVTMNGNKTVTANFLAIGATIRYTTDGSTPSSTVGTVYTGPVAISTTTTLKAIAYKSGMNPSAIASANYTINIAPTCPHLIGDVNCTGTVDNGDLAKLANFINGDPSIPANDVGITQNGDINCTGTIDAADLAKLANAAYGIDPDGHNLPIPPNPAFVCGGNGNMNTSSGTTHVPQPNVSYLEQSLGKLAGLFIDQAEAQTTTTTSQFVGNTSVRVNNVPSDTQPLTFIKVNSRISPWPIRILWSPYGTSNTLNQYNESYYGTCDVENNAQCTAEYPANQ
jgi:uncharacterized repeat protein (TIGR02543 family)